MLTVALLTALLATDPPDEAPIPPGVVALEEPGRYRSNRSFDETIEFYKRSFRRVWGLRWHHIVSLPGIKAKNIECQRKKSNWEGINIYEHAGEVRIYVIPRERPPEPPPKPAPKTGAPPATTRAR